MPKRLLLGPLMNRKNGFSYLFRIHEDIWSQCSKFACTSSQILYSMPPIFIFLKYCYWVSQLRQVLFLAWMFLLSLCVCHPCLLSQQLLYGVYADLCPPGWSDFWKLLFTLFMLCQIEVDPNSKIWSLRQRECILWFF